MARLIQANLMISEREKGAYRIYATVHMQMGVGIYAYDFDITRDLKTGDPLVNGQLEELVLGFCEELYREEKGGAASKRRREVEG